MSAFWRPNLHAISFKHMAARLEQLQAENQRLAQALLAVQDQERMRLAQTLHDDLGQYLAGIRAQACLLGMLADQPAAVRHTSQRLDANCEHLQQGFRTLLTDLHPQVLQQLPLDQALKRLIKQWRATHGIECLLDMDQPLPSLCAASSAHLYRLLQEALTNVVRHASATQVRVCLKLREAGLTLSVGDNGCGSSLGQTAQPEGFGLYSMRQRARCLKGALSIQTAPGAGWSLVLHMPLEA